MTCTTHRDACECRQAIIQGMARALREAELALQAVQRKSEYSGRDRMELPIRTYLGCRETQGVVAGVLDRARNVGWIP